MTQDKHYETLQSIIAELALHFTNKSISFAVSGSSVYGSPNGTKPTSDSDVDATLILDKLDLPEKVLSSSDLSLEGRSLFEDGELDILAIRAIISSRDVLFHCYTPSSYENACQGKTQLLALYKRLRCGKHPRRHTYDYRIYGFHQDAIAQSRIVCLHEGHLISYPNTASIDGKFALTVFQDQISTQIEYLDHHNLATSRENLAMRIRAAAEQEQGCPISLFRGRSPHWSESFNRLISARFSP